MRYWIDKKTGRFGDADDLVFTEDDPKAGNYGADMVASGHLVELLRHAHNLNEIEFQAGEDALMEHVCETDDDDARALSDLREVADGIMRLGNFDVFGGQTCQACGLTGIHSRHCLAHELAWL